MAENAATQNDTSNEGHLERTLPVGRDLVWRAFTDATMLQQWYAPPGWSLDLNSAEVELRPGGAYRVSMHKDDDPLMATNVVARFTDVLPEQLLVSRESVFGASGLAPSEMVLSIALQDDDGGTKVTIRQEPFPYGVADLSRDGWTAALDRLAALLITD